ncbi:MAG: hypothetical protein AAF558_05895 [Verrucomicrobiota bacterium]
MKNKVITFLYIFAVLGAILVTKTAVIPSHVQAASLDMRAASDCGEDNPPDESE